MQSKKIFVLLTLFVLPIVIYLFFASGVYNFGKLAVLNTEVKDIAVFTDEVSFKDNITVLGFLGSNLEVKKTNAFNLNQKIYKRFYQFNDFQFVVVVPKGTESKVAALKKELATLADVEKWRFVFLADDKITSMFDSLKTGYTLDDYLSSDYVFIIDKDGNLRGRNDDEDEKDGLKYGFNALSVSELNNKMIDDIKIILAEYRMALKKNKANR